MEIAAVHLNLIANLSTGDLALSNPTLVTLPRHSPLDALPAKATEIHLSISVQIFI